MVKETVKAMARATPAAATHPAAPKNQTTKEHKKDYKRHKKQK
jgi:hypothetical protein